MKLAGGDISREETNEEGWPMSVESIIIISTSTGSSIVGERSSWLVVVMVDGSVLMATSLWWCGPVGGEDLQTVDFVVAVVVAMMPSIELRVGEEGVSGGSSLLCFIFCRFVGLGIIPVIQHTHTHTHNTHKVQVGAVAGCGEERESGNGILLGSAVEESGGMDRRRRGSWLDREGSNKILHSQRQTLQHTGRHRNAHTHRHRQEHTHSQHSHSLVVNEKRRERRGNKIDVGCLSPASRRAPFSTLAQFGTASVCFCCSNIPIGEAIEDASYLRFKWEYEKMWGRKLLTIDEFRTACMRISGRRSIRDAQKVAGARWKTMMVCINTI